MKAKDIKVRLFSRQHSHCQHRHSGASVSECIHKTESIDGCLQVAKKAVTATGYLCRGEQEQRILNLHVDALLETATVKSDVVPFAAGEALCFAFKGEALRPAQNCDFTANQTAVLHVT